MKSLYWQRLKVAVSNYFKIWWLPVFFFLLPLAVFIPGLIFRSDFLVDLSLIIFLFNSFGTIIASVLQLIKGKWYFMVLQTVILVFLLFLVGMLFTFSAPDFYGAHKTIPANIEIASPLDSAPAKSDFKKYNLILEEYGQPGIYRYYTTVKPKENGFFYIKAYEITSNDRLSESAILKRSKINAAIKTYDSTFVGEFTIYEGSWGDKFGARIELWFQPSDSGLTYKLTERNFIVEGWTR